MNLYGLDLGLKEDPLAGGMWESLMQMITRSQEVAAENGYEMPAPLPPADPYEEIGLSSGLAPETVFPGLQSILDWQQMPDPELQWRYDMLGQDEPVLPPGGGETVYAPEPNLLERAAGGIADLASGVVDTLQPSLNATSDAFRFLNNLPGPLGNYEHQGSQSPLDLSEYPGAQTVRGAAGDAGAFVGRQLDRAGQQDSLVDVPFLPEFNPGGPSAESVGRTVGESIVPTTYAELAAAPLIGLAPGVDDLGRGLVRGARNYVDDAARMAIPPTSAVRPVEAPPALLRTEGTNLPSFVSPTQADESIGAVGGGALKKPSPGTGQPLSATGAPATGATPGAAPTMADDLESQLAASIEQAKARKAPPATKTGPAPKAAPTTEDDLLQQLEAARASGVPLDPAVVRQARAGRTPAAPPTPAVKAPPATSPAAPTPIKGAITKSDGSTVPASPEELTDAARRVFSRGSETARGATIDISKIETPEQLEDALVNLVRNGRTRGGVRLMAGVDDSAVRDAVRGLVNDIEIVQYGTGTRPRWVARFRQPDAFKTAVDEALEAPAAPTATAGGGSVTPPSGPRLQFPREGGDQPRFPGSDWKPGVSVKDRVIQNLVDLYSLPRSLLSTMDFSYPLRQGLIMARHGQEFGAAFGTGLRSFFDDDLAQSTMARLMAQDRGTLHISPLTGGKLLDREEQFLSRIVEKIPLARRSQQASIVFINKLRADVYDTITRGWQRTGYTPNANDLSGLGNYINRATGYGSLGAFENAAGTLATGFFSPRLLMSRVQAPGYMFHSSSKVRQEAIKDFLAVFGGTSALLSLAHYSGLADVEVDPRSTDFGKMRIGGTRVDPWGGYQQLARYTAQILSGERKSASDAIGDIDVGDTIFRFIRSKFSPSTGLAYDLASGKSMIGDEVSPGKWQEIIKRSVVPLFWQGMVEAIQEEGLRGGLLAAPGFFGVGSQTFERSVGEKLNDRTMLLPPELRTDSSGKVLTRWNDLTNAQQVMAGRHDPELVKIEAGDPEAKPSEAREKLAEYADRRAGAFSAFQESGNGKGYRETLSDIGLEQKGASSVLFTDDKKESGDRALVTGFFDELEKAGSDYEERDRLETRYRSSLTPEQNKVLDDALLTSADPNYEKLKKARDYLDKAYWQQRDAAYEELIQKTPEGSPARNYPTYDDVIKAANDRTSPDPVAQRLLTATGTQMSRLDAKRRLDDPKADALLYIYGYRETVISAQAQAMAVAWAKENGVQLAAPMIKGPQ